MGVRKRGLMAPPTILGTAISMGSDSVRPITAGLLAEYADMSGAA